MKRYGVVPNNRRKLSRYQNKLAIIYDDKAKEDVVYEFDYQARLRWKRPDVCSACAGHGHTGMITHSITKGTSYYLCILCNGSGRTKDRLDYNSGHREL